MHIASSALCGKRPSGDSRWGLCSRFIRFRVNFTMSAGRVTFEVNHAASGDTEHEFVVLKTDMDDAHLPVHKGQVTESRFKKMGEVEDLARGSTKRLSLKLAPGHYVLICNRPGHYEMGMHTSFVVAR